MKRWKKDGEGMKGKINEESKGVGQSNGRGSDQIIVFIYQISA